MRQVTVQWAMAAGAAVLLAGAALGQSGGKGDLSTPAKALETYQRAVLSGDAETAKRAVTGEAGAAETVEAQVKATKGLRDLRDALSEQFGAEKVGTQLPTLVSELKQMEDRAKADLEAAASAVTAGDTATVKVKESETTSRVVTLKKVGGEWKVVASGSSREAKSLEDLRSRLTAVVNRARLGMYKTPTEAARAVGDVYQIEGRTWQTVAEAPPAPATKPATTKPATEEYLVPATGRWKADWSTPANSVMTFYRAMDDGLPLMIERGAVFEDAALADSVMSHAKLMKALHEFIDSLKAKFDVKAVEQLFSKQVAIMKGTSGLAPLAAGKVPDPTGDEMDVKGLLVPGGGGGQITKIKKDKEKGEWRVSVTRVGTRYDEKKAKALAEAVQLDLGVYSILADKAKAEVFKSPQEAYNMLQVLTGQAPPPDPKAPKGSTKGSTRGSGGSGGGGGRGGKPGA